MNENGFSAALKTQSGKLLEYGVCEFSPDEKEIIFTADFVPLLKLGEKVCAVRIFGGEEKQRFNGKVYTSSEKLMRITLENSPKKSTNEQWRFLFNTSVKARVQSIDEPLKGSYPAVVYSISENTVKFNCENCFSKKEWLRVYTDGEIKITDLKAEVESIIRLEKGVCCHICKIIHISPAAAQSLGEKYEAR